MEDWDFRRNGIGQGAKSPCPVGDHPICPDGMELSEKLP